VAEIAIGFFRQILRCAFFAAWWWRYAHRSTHCFVEFDWTFKLNWRRLWQCNKCGRYFANRNQSHACGADTLLINVQRHYRVNFPHRITFGLASPV
jgi:ubiquitin C-terminal hydrolase